MPRSQERAFYSPGCLLPDILLKMADDGICFLSSLGVPPSRQPFSSDYLLLLHYYHMGSQRCISFRMAHEREYDSDDACIPRPPRRGAGPAGARTGRHATSTFSSALLVAFNIIDALLYITLSGRCAFELFHQARRAPPSASRGDRHSFQIALWR